MLARELELVVARCSETALKRDLETVIARLLEMVLARLETVDGKKLLGAAIVRLWTMLARDFEMGGRKIEARRLIGDNPPGGRGRQDQKFWEGLAKLGPGLKFDQEQ